jgi:hypothetical protein
LRRQQLNSYRKTLHIADGKGACSSTVKGSISTTESTHPVLAKNQTVQQLQAMNAEEQELVRQRRLWLNEWKLDSQDCKYVVERKIEFNDVSTNGVSKPFVSRTSSPRLKSAC